MDVAPERQIVRMDWTVMRLSMSEMQMKRPVVPRHAAPLPERLLEQKNDDWQVTYAGIGMGRRRVGGSW
jgi:hypothetical protein